MQLKSKTYTRSHLTWGSKGDLGFSGAMQIFMQAAKKKGAMCSLRYYSNPKCNVIYTLAHTKDREELLTSLKCNSNESNWVWRGNNTRINCGGKSGNYKLVQGRVWITIQVNINL